MWGVRVSSVVVGLVGGSLTAALWLYFHLTGWATEQVWLTASVASVAVAVTTGLCFSALVQRWTREVRQLTEHVRGLRRERDPQRGGSLLSHVTYPRRDAAAGVDLGGLVDEVEAALQDFASRLDELTTHRRELDVRLRIAESERKHMEAILDVMSDAVLVTDAFNELALANEAAARLLHFDVDHAARQPIDRVVADPALVNLIKNTAEGSCIGRMQRRKVEHRLTTDHGKAMSSVYDVTLASMMGSERAGAPGRTDRAGVVTILRDVTREREIAEMKTEFVSSVSHEMRTPLSSIKAYLEMLMDGEATDEAARQEFYGVIQGETNRLQRLIENILNISRIEAGVVRAQRERVSLREIVEETCSVMRPQARGKRLQLDTAVSPVPCEVFVDRDMVTQVLVNLIGNAIKYTPQDGSVSVAVDVDELSNVAQVSVTDTGVGIPPADLPHIFEKFYRVSQHRKLAKGTGLGLNLVQQIVESVHGGKLSATSEPKRGSTFTFTLPLAERDYGERALVA